MKYGTTLLIAFILCTNFGFTKDSSKCQFGLHISTALTGYQRNINDMQLSFNTGPQVKYKIYKSFDVVSGLYYANYKSKYNLMSSIRFNTSETVIEEYTNVMSLRYLCIPVLIRFNYKRFYATTGVGLNINIGYNHHFIKEFDFNRKLNDIKSFALGSKLAIGYQFKFNEKFHLDAELYSGSLSKNYTENIEYSAPYFSMLGAGITVYYDFLH